MDKRKEKERLLIAMKEQLNRKARTDLLTFTIATMPTLIPADFHRRYYKALDDFAKGKIKKLAVFMPPQHGKSEGSTRRLPAYALGLDPNKKIAIVSYSDTKAKKFGRECQRIIDSKEYNQIFPETLLGLSHVADVSGTWTRTANEAEIVDHSGSLKAVGVGGPLTGEPVDMLIMDDLYKDAKSAWSSTIRESVSDWYDTVADTRLHNGSQQLIVFTRWHENDLAGRLLKIQGEFDQDTNPDGWVVIKFPAIKIGAPSEWDPREEGEALWPERHSLHDLQIKRKKNPHVFESLYQQDPKPAEGLMYDSGFRTYDVIPYDRKMIRKNYTDTADTGEDYLCSINYVETSMFYYVTDVLFTQKPMEYTEPMTAKMLSRGETDQALIESNNGGRGFARNVEKQCRIIGNRKTKIKWFHQKDNKEIRIFSHSAEVQNLILFPTDWSTRWPEFYNAVTGYMKTGHNEHDDAPDALTGIVEHGNTGKTKQNLNGLFG